MNKKKPIVASPATADPDLRKRIRDIISGRVKPKKNSPTKIISAEEFQQLFGTESVSLSLGKENQRLKEPTETERYKAAFDTAINSPEFKKAMDAYDQRIDEGVKQGKSVEQCMREEADKALARIRQRNASKKV